MRQKIFLLECIQIQIFSMETQPNELFPFPYSALISHRSKIDPNNMDRTLHAINTISGLLQGPFEVGNALVGHQGVMEMMVALCGSEREVDQMVAVEALIHASTKMSRASFIITNGVSLLKDIYKKTKNEKIKIRALVVSEPRIEQSRPLIFSTSPKIIRNVICMHTHVHFHDRVCANWVQLEVMITT